MVTELILQPLTTTKPTKSESLCSKDPYFTKNESSTKTTRRKNHFLTLFGRFVDGDDEDENGPTSR